MIALSACTQSGSQSGKTTPLSMMTSVAKQVQQCWFKKKDPAFRAYKMASELDSYSGKPRILIVPKSNPAGLPKLVAQAERIKGTVQFTSFGPLLASAEGSRLNNQLLRWSQGTKTC